jgi:hypothetical protein
MIVAPLLVAAVKRRKAEAIAASMARIRKKEEDFAEHVRDGRRKEAARLVRDAEIEAVRKARLAEMQKRALSFSKKRSAKIERILKDKQELEQRMDKIGNEKERLLEERDAQVAARAAAKNAQIRAANKKKQREIRKRLKAKNRELAEIETQRDADFAEKIQTVNSRLESFEENRQRATQQKIRAKEESAEERAVRLEKLRLQREMAGSSNLDKAAMKAIICEQAFERKRDHCLHNAIENQSRFAEKLAYIEQQRRVEKARVAAMTEESDMKAVRSQKVIDAKREVGAGRSAQPPYTCHHTLDPRLHLLMSLHPCMISHFAKTMFALSPSPACAFAVCQEARGNVQARDSETRRAVRKGGDPARRGFRPA